MCTKYQFVWKKFWPQSSGNKKFAIIWLKSPICCFYIGWDILFKMTAILTRFNGSTSSTHSTFILVISACMQISFLLKKLFGRNRLETKQSFVIYLKTCIDCFYIVVFYFRVIITILSYDDHTWEHSHCGVEQMTEEAIGSVVSITNLRQYKEDTLACFLVARPFGRKPCWV